MFVKEMALLSSISGHNFVGLADVLHRTTKHYQTSIRMSSFLNVIQKKTVLMRLQEYIVFERYQHLYFIEIEKK